MVQPYLRLEDGSVTPRLRAWQRHLTTGVLKAVVLVHPGGEHFDRIVQAVEIVNDAQSFFRLEVLLDERGRWLSKAPGTRAAEPIRKKIRAAFPTDLVIAMLEQDLSDGFTVDEEPGCTLISCSNWDETDEAPSTRVYLVYQLVSALITFAGCLSFAENVALLHGTGDDDDENGGLPRGCLYDHWDEAKKLRMSMICARLCETCRAALLAHGTPQAAIDATEKILEWVRSVVLGRERSLPRKVFIGHGRNPEWMKLAEMLKEWGLTVEEFNEEPVAGVSVTQRLKSMLDQSRFAFLVMTGEDGTGEGRLRARMNVIHEIGLFQGRLGSEYAVVLRDSKAEMFSNLDGINRLEFQPKQLIELRQEIFRLLVRRGVLAADAEENAVNEKPTAAAKSASATRKPSTGSRNQVKYKRRSRGTTTG